MFRTHATSRLVAPFVFALVSTSAFAVDLIGYVPYYRMGDAYVSDVLPGQLAMLDEVRYFGLTSDGNGEIVPLANSMQSHLDNIATLQAAIDALPIGQRPRLNLTLGGADQDAPFTSVAASATSSAALAQNITALLDATGATSVDIDWEHPNVGVELTTSYPALLQRIRQEVGPERRVYATVAPSLVLSNDVFNGPNAIDGASLMTYDLGWWSGDPNNSHNGEHSLQEYAEDAVEAWTEPPGSQNDRPWVFGTWGNGSPADQLGIALPFYGRALNNQTAYTYAELAANATTAGNGYYSYQGQQVWAPTPELAAQRVEFAHEQGLQHVIIWEIAQDLPPDHADSLLRSAFAARQSLLALSGDFDRDGDVDRDDYLRWHAGFGMATGASVTDGDANSDGRVDGADLLIWQLNFGRTNSGSAVPSALPEPTSSWLLLVAAAWSAACAASNR